MLNPLPWLFRDIPISDDDSDVSVATQTALLALAAAVAGATVHLLACQGTRCGHRWAALRYIPPVEGCSTAACRGYAMNVVKSATLGVILGPLISGWNYLLDRHLSLWEPGAEATHAALIILLECLVLNPILALIAAMWQDVCFGRRTGYTNLVHYVVDEVLPALQVSFFIWPIATVFEPLVDPDWANLYETVVWTVDLGFLFVATLRSPFVNEHHGEEELHAALSGEAETTLDGPDPAHDTVEQRPPLSPSFPDTTPQPSLPCDYLAPIER
jgi:hypothetical protein